MNSIQRRWRVIFALLFMVISQPLLAAKIALINANLVDVSELKILPEQTIVISNNRIERIVMSRGFKPAKNTLVIDLKGQYIIPGLIDGHVHHATDPDNGDNMRTTLLRLQNLLRGGVTSVRDMGGDARVLGYLKRQADLDEIQSPDIYFSVIIGGDEFFADPRTISSAKGFKAGETSWMRSINANSNFDDIVLAAKGLGASGIKIYADVPSAIIKPLATAAKKHGLQVWTHAFVGPDKPLSVVEAGVDVISHMTDLSAQIIEHYKAWRRKNADISAEQLSAAFEADNYQSLIQSIKTHGTIVDATMTVFEENQSSSNGASVRYQLSKFLTRLAHQQGVKISAGTDAFSNSKTHPYPMIHHEMQLLVNDAELTPLQALQAATLYNAEAIGIEKDYGSIEVNKIANLVVLSADPTADIQNTTAIVHVIKNGQFIYRGDDPRLPFSSARRDGNTLWMSGQIGNLPGTMVLDGNNVESQMTRAMNNIGAVLQEHQLTFNAVTKCTLMLADIADWKKASDIYREYFPDQLPTRSAFAATGLALNAKVEIECIASY